MKENRTEMLSWELGLSMFAPGESSTTGSSRPLSFEVEFSVCGTCQTDSPGVGVALKVIGIRSLLKVW